MADATPPPWMQPGAPPTHAKKEAVPPPQPMEQDGDDEDLYGTETQEQADAKFMAALDANEARKAAKQAALDLQAKEGTPRGRNKNRRPHRMAGMRSRQKKF